MNIDVGSTIGDYQVVGVLGAGGMGKVFKVRNVISDRIEAMKVLLPDLSGEPDLADRFLREIKVQASLSHPNIANLHTALRFENQLLMLMEFVEGETLDERLKRGRVPVDEAVDYVGQALSALSYAHQHGVVHRDIKPANMMLTANGVIKLMDFGIAKSGADRKLTMTGTTMGSLYYMSPEQIRGVQTLDPRSDLYSVGVSLYELVTGQRPFEGESQFSIMSAHLEKDPQPPIALDPSMSPALNEIILTAVQREPERRFQSAEAFRKALTSVATPSTPAARAPVAAAPPSALAATAPAPRSRRFLWVATGTVGAIAAIVAVVEFSPSKRADAGAPEPAPVSAPASTPAAAPAQPAPASPNPTSPAQPEAPAASPPPQSALPPAVILRPQTRGPDSRPVSRAAIPASSSGSASATPPPTPAVAQPQAGSAAPAAAPPPQSTPTPDVQARRAELQVIRESLARLSARAAAIRNSLQNLQRSQAAGGLGLRRDWVEAAGLMDTFIRGAADALAANDASAARDLMDKAEIQVDKLDKALK